ncbi:MAG: filamentous hemagglutinin N-terminal domain-containing protein, partial [Xanthobacteraceae bacterium]
MTHFFRNLALATTALLPLGIGFAVAGPTGGVVVGGEATIRDQGSRNVTIDQWSHRAVINWYTFNIGAGESTRFNQPDSSSVVLNRVTGGVGPSEIFGTVTANGRVFVINRDGILFGPNAVIDTAGFLATTSDIKNDDFMAGRYNFNIPGRPDASIVNHGTITAQSAGFAALVAPGVRNTGTITATLGTVGLAAGNSFTLDLYGDKLITLAVGDSIAGQVRDVQTGQTLNSLVENTGRLRANGGRVELTAAAARTVVDSVINNTGVVEANRIGQRGGTIVLSAATAGTKGAGAPKQTVKLSGTLSAAAKDGGKGGKVVVTGEDIQVTGAHVDVSGPAGGGTVLIGGDWGGGSPTGGLVKHPGARLENEKIPTAATVTIDRNTVINASATSSGAGGKVIVWSDEKTSFAGTILATGGPSGGDGGFAEVSGHMLLDYRGLTDLRAPQGKFGTLLLDPYDVRISNDDNSDLSGFTPTGNESNINIGRLQNALQLASVVVTTGGAGSPGYQTGNITVESSISWTGSSTLMLSAYHDININPGVVISNIGAGNLILRADNSGSRGGTVNFDRPDWNNYYAACLYCNYNPTPPGKIDFSQSTGTVSLYYNPTPGITGNKYDNPRDYTGNVIVGVPGHFTPYMLVNSGNDLQLV